MASTAAPVPSKSVFANPWTQLVIGIICMAAVANLQYGWTLFVNPMDAKYHWGRASIQVAFTIFVLATNLTYSVSAREPIPTIGLSGVVWGFMGLFLVKYPKDNINCFVWYLWVFKTIEVPALIFILAFLALDIGAFRNEPNSNVNHVAHISGFLAGALFMLIRRVSDQRA